MWAWILFRDAFIDCVNTPLECDIVAGQVDRWSGGQVVRWTGGQVDRWLDGQVVRWTGG